MVGDEMVRGISGGQKKRLTTGKIIFFPEFLVLDLDYLAACGSSSLFVGW